jgi:hypothetical protein
MLQGHKKANGDAEDGTYKDLDGCMSDEFTQALFSHGVTLEGFVDHLVEDAGLDAHGPAHASCIVHYNACHYDGDGEGR